MTQSNRQLKAALFAVMGATGSGKTTHVMNELKKSKPGRLLVWDAKGEFAREGWAQPVKSIAELSRLLLAAGARGKFKLAYQPFGERKAREKDFDRFCQLAFHAKNVTLIAEELSSVTRAGWCPFGWELVTTQGRTEGLTVYGLSQSPALMDKTFLTNCTYVHSGRLNDRNHAKVIAGAMDCSPDEIIALQDGEFMRRTFSPRNLERGSVFT